MTNKSIAVSRRPRTIPSYIPGMRPGESYTDFKNRLTNEGMGWHVTGLNEWSSDEIFRTLQGLGIDVDADTFRGMAEASASVDDLIENWTSDFPPKDLWIDFPLMSAMTLWKRLAPDVLRSDLLAAYIDQDLGETDLDDPKADRAAYIGKLRWLCDYLDQFHGDDKQQQWLRIEKDVIDDPIAIMEYAIGRLSAEYPNDMLRLVDTIISADPENAVILLMSLMNAFEELGRLQDVQPLVERYRTVRPHDPNAIYPVFMLALARRDDSATVEAAVEALKSSRAAGLWTITMDRIVQDLTDAGRDDLVAIVADRAASIREFDEVFNRSQRDKPQPVHVAHVGRNDPCTCGSGTKYKKCCGR